MLQCAFTGLEKLKMHGLSSGNGDGNLLWPTASTDTSSINVFSTLINCLTTIRHYTMLFDVIILAENGSETEQLLYNYFYQPSATTTAGAMDHIYRLSLTYETMAIPNARVVAVCDGKKPGDVGSTKYVSTFHIFYNHRSPDTERDMCEILAQGNAVIQELEIVNNACFNDNDFGTCLGVALGAYESGSIQV